MARPILQFEWVHRRGGVHSAGKIENFDRRNNDERGVSSTKKESFVVDRRECRRVAWTRYCQGFVV